MGNSVSKGYKLVGNTVIYAIGNLGSQILNIALLPLYSVYLSKGEYGYFDLAISGMALLVPIITLQISDSAFRWLVTDKNSNSAVVITNTIAFVCLSLVFYSFIIYGITRWVSIQHSILLLLMLISSSIYPVTQQITRGLGKSKLYAFTGILFTLILLVSNLSLLIGVKLGIEAVLISVVLANFICALFLLLYQKIWSMIDVKLISITEIGKLLKYSIPLVSNSISWWLVNSVNRYLILIFLGIEANGIFGIANRFPALLTMINSVFILAWQESAITNSNDKQKEAFFSKVFDHLSSVLLSATALMIISSRIIVEKLIGSQFGDSWKYMPFLFIGVVFSSFSGFWGSFYLSSKNTKGIFWTTLAGSIVNIVFAIILTKRWGLYGVSFSTAFGFLFMWILRLMDIKKHLTLQYNYTNFSILFIICIVSGLILFYGTDWQMLISIPVLIGLLFWINISKIKGYFQLVFYKKLQQ